MHCTHSRDTAGRGEGPGLSSGGGRAGDTHRRRAGGWLEEDWGGQAMTDPTEGCSSWLDGLKQCLLPAAFAADGIEAFREKKIYQQGCYPCTKLFTYQIQAN